MLYELPKNLNHDCVPLSALYVCMELIPSFDMTLEKAQTELGKSGDEAVPPGKLIQFLEKQGLQVSHYSALLNNEGFENPTIETINIFLRKLNIRNIKPEAVKEDLDYLHSRSDIVHLLPDVFGDMFEQHVYDVFYSTLSNGGKVILTLEGNHAVVINSFKDGNFYIYDPDEGEVSILVEELFQKAFKKVEHDGKPYQVGDFTTVNIK